MGRGDFGSRWIVFERDRVRPDAADSRPGRPGRRGQRELRISDRLVLHEKGNLSRNTIAITRRHDNTIVDRNVPFSLRVILERS